MSSIPALESVRRRTLCGCLYQSCMCGCLHQSYTTLNLVLGLSPPPLTVSGPANSLYRVCLLTLHQHRTKLRPDPAQNGSCANWIERSYASARETGPGPHLHPLQHTLCAPHRGGRVGAQHMMHNHHPTRRTNNAPRVHAFTLSEPRACRSTCGKALLGTHSLCSSSSLPQVVVGGGGWQDRGE